MAHHLDCIRALAVITDIQTTEKCRVVIGVFKSKRNMKELLSQPDASFLNRIKEHMKTHLHVNEINIESVTSYEEYNGIDGVYDEDDEGAPIWEQYGLTQEEWVAQADISTYLDFRAF